MDPPEKNLLSNHTKYSLFFNTIYFSLSNVCLKEKKNVKKKKKNRAQLFSGNDVHEMCV